MERPRAADDFDVIRARLKELRREREEAAAPGDEAEVERQRREHEDGAPPPWVPTIFLPQPTD